MPLNPRAKKPSLASHWTRNVWKSGGGAAAAEEAPAVPAAEPSKAAAAKMRAAWKVVLVFMTVSCLT